MKLTRSMIVLVVVMLFSAVTAFAAPKRFEHIIVIVQENRTPDNLFHELCDVGCSTTDLTRYNIKQDNWPLQQSTTLTVTPQPTPLVVTYDLGHSHADFASMCDWVLATPGQKGYCKMDGPTECKPPKCPPNTLCPNPCPSNEQQNAQVNYVQSSDVRQYLQMAIHYGWANKMFQTNQGPSFPAHQFIFAGTSAPTDGDDDDAIFAADNTPNGYYGCSDVQSPPDPNRSVRVISDNDSTTPPYYPGLESPDQTTATQAPCFHHATVLTDLLDLHTPDPVSWKYYSFEPIWTAPNAIDSICISTPPPPDRTKKVCGGTYYTEHVVRPGNEDANKPGVLYDITNGCSGLAGVSWVIPTMATNSDHAGWDGAGGGPAWVTSIVDAIGDSPCGYWKNTAIIVTWDDWGGWYDHEPPPIPAGTQKWADYQYGFRVPLLFISAYTPPSYINNNPQDFGSILRFIEHNFTLVNDDNGKSGPGALGFADARGPNGVTDHLAGFYDLTATPRSFHDIPSTWPPCANGQRWDLTNGACECPDRSQWDSYTGSCVCPKGTMLDPTGHCIHCDPSTCF